MATRIDNKELTNRSTRELSSDAELLQAALNLLPKLGNNWNVHNLVTLKRTSLSRIIYYYELYQKIVHVPGVICEFGVHWGATLALLVNLRGILEPYNVSRSIIGFDTFDGFSHVDKNDGNLVSVGDYKSLPGYEIQLENILHNHEQSSPVSHIKKFELVKGDASFTIKGWLKNNTSSIISMAIFDMDVYKPTKDVLENIIPRLTKGSLLVFDELNCPHFPGETLAVQEILGLNNMSLRRVPDQSYCAYAIFGE